MDHFPAYTGSGRNLEAANREQNPNSGSVWFGLVRQFTVQFGGSELDLAITTVQGTMMLVGNRRPSTHFWYQEMFHKELDRVCSSLNFCESCYAKPCTCVRARQVITWVLSSMESSVSRCTEARLLLFLDPSSPPKNSRLKSMCVSTIFLSE